jgi:hypothetical protein
MQHVWISLQEAPYSPNEVITNKILIKKKNWTGKGVNSL